MERIRAYRGPRGGARRPGGRHVLLLSGPSLCLLLWGCATPYPAASLPPPAPSALPAPVLEPAPAPRSVPQLSVFPQRVDFGAVGAGEVGVAAVSVRNDGDETIRLDDAFTEGIGFDLEGGGCGGRLRPGESCAVRVRFSPAARGAHSGAVIFGLSSPAQQQLAVPLRGEGLVRRGPQIYARPGLLDFGAAEPGAPETLDVEVGNEGSGELHVHSARAEGSGFELSADRCSGRTLGFGETCRVSVRFTSAKAREYGGSLTVSSNDPAQGRLAVRLRGRGGPGSPAVRIAPERLDFGAVYLGLATTVDVRVWNDGRADLDVRDAAVEGRGFALDFDGCERSTVSPGRYCALSVRFAPAQAGGQRGELTLVTNDPRRKRAAVPLTGEGRQRRGPPVRLDPISLDFGRVAEGTSKTLPVKVRNDSQTGVRVLAVETEGKDFEKRSDACSGKVVEPGRDCMVAVQFQPEAQGARSGSLAVVADGPTRERIVIRLRGEGTRVARPILRVDPAKGDFGRLEAGAGPELEFRVRNEGDAPLRVQAVSVEGRGFEVQSDTCSRAQVPPRQSCTIAVRIAAGAAGQLSGGLRIDSDDPEHGRVTVPLKGLVADRGSPRHCRREKLELPPLAKGVSRLSVRGALEPNSCVVYTVRAPAAGALSVCVPTGYRVSGDGFEDAGRRRGLRVSQPSGSCSRRPSVTAEEDVTLMVVRGDKSQARAEFVFTLDSRGKDAGDDD